MGLGDRFGEWKDKRDAKKVSFAEGQEAFANSEESLKALQDYDPEPWSAGQKDAARTGAADQTRRLIAAQQSALADPGAVATQDAQSIKRAAAITGEGADAIAEGSAITSAEVEAGSEASELSERDRKTSEAQRLLANVAAGIEARRTRRQGGIAAAGEALDALLGEGEGIIR